MSSVLKRGAEKAKNVLATAGVVVSGDKSMYIMLISAVVLLIASMCVPYYTDSTGASSGVYGSGKDCLGFSGQDCMTMHALPVVTILFGALTIAFMAGLPILDKVPRFRNLGQTYTAFGITIIPVLFLAMVFSVATLATQLGMPLSGSSLADQAKNSSSTTTFKDGMALSAASTALFVFVFIIKSEVISKLAGRFM
jgi:hypothetical protein